MTIFDCKETVRQTRFEVYRYGAKHYAISPTISASDSIRYDENHLKISLMFDTGQPAAAFVSDMLDTFPTPGDDDPPYLESEITTCTLPGVDSRVRLERRNFKAGETTSPTGSVSVVSVSISDQASVFADDDKVFQMIQHPSILGSVTTDNCHLVDKARCAEVKICSGSCVSNLVVGTPDIHRMLDGQSNCAPFICLQPVGIVEQYEFDSFGLRRTRVNLRLHLRDQAVASVFNQRLKDGSVRIEACIFETFVHVIDPHIFMQAATWKMNSTLDKWMRTLPSLP